MVDIAPKTLPEDKVYSNAPTGKKRGRPAGTTNTVKASGDVEQAMATLDTAYQFLTLGLTMIGAPIAAGDLAEKIAYVQEQNRGYLNADRKLAATIAKVGSASGRAGFIVTNVMALAPVAIQAAKELQARKPAPKPAAAPNEPNEPAPAPAPFIDGNLVPDIVEA